MFGRKSKLEQEWEQVAARTPEFTIGGLYHVPLDSKRFVHATIADIDVDKSEVTLNGIEGTFKLDDLVWVSPTHQCSNV